MPLRKAHQPLTLFSIQGRATDYTTSLGPTANHYMNHKTTPSKYSAAARLQLFAKQKTP